MSLNALADAQPFAASAKKYCQPKIMVMRSTSLNMVQVASLVVPLSLQIQAIASMFTRMEPDAAMMALLQAHATMTFS